MIDRDVQAFIASVGIAIVFILIAGAWLAGEISDPQSRTRKNWENGGPVYVVGYWLYWIASRPFVWGWYTFVILFGIMTVPIVLLLRLVAALLLLPIDAYLAIRRFLDAHIDWWLLKHQLDARVSWWVWRKWTADYLPACPWCHRKRVGSSHSCKNDTVRHYWQPWLNGPETHGDYDWFCSRCGTKTGEKEAGFHIYLCPVCAGKRRPEDAPRRSARPERTKSPQQLLRLVTPTATMYDAAGQAIQVAEGELDSADSPVEV